MRFRSTPATARRPRLALTPLEARDVPAGNVAFALSAAGVLSLVGDTQNNGVTVKVTGTDVTVTPDATTTVNGGTAGVAVTKMGVAKSLSAKMDDGADALAIDGAAAFALTGAATIDLGGGDDTLDFSTTDKVALGKITVTGGEGTDNVTVRGGVGKGSQISGAAQFNLGVGAGLVTLGGDGVTYKELNVTGALGVTADGGTNGVNVVAKNLTVGGATAITFKGYQQTTGATFTDSALHAVSMTGYAVGLALTTSTVTGNVSAKSLFSASVIDTGTPVTGNISATAAYQAVVSVSTATVGGNVSATAGNTTAVALTTATVTGNVSAGAKVQSTVSSTGISSVKNLTVSSGIVADVTVSGTSLTVAGNLSVTGAASAGLSVTTSALSEVKGNVNVKGGWAGGRLNVNNGNFKADKNVTVDMGAFNGLVSIGGGAAVASILGNLAVKGGVGDDSVTLTHVNVAGTTTINTGAGKDTLTIESGSTFAKAFSADLGNGDDLISLAQNTGSAAPVTFTDKVTILAGAGNDTLKLGNAQPAVGTGDANSRVVFTVASKIDGGTGYNLFDKELGQFTGPVTIPTLTWTDPTP